MPGRSRAGHRRGQKNTRESTRPGGPRGLRTPGEPNAAPPHPRRPAPRPIPERARRGQVPPPPAIHPIPARLRLAATSLRGLRRVCGPGAGNMEALLKRELGYRSVKAAGHSGGGCISQGQSYDTDRGRVFVKVNTKAEVRAVAGGSGAGLWGPRAGVRAGVRLWRPGPCQGLRVGVRGPCPDGGAVVRRRSGSGSAGRGPALASVHVRAWRGGDGLGSEARVVVRVRVQSPHP